jgi:hypothetical protein
MGFNNSSFFFKTRHLFMYYMKEIRPKDGKWTISNLKYGFKIYSYYTFFFPAYIVVSYF